MLSLTVHAQTRYEIKFIQDLFNSDLLIEDCKNKASQFVIISDDTVSALYAQRLKNILEQLGSPVHVATFPPGEHYKTRETKAKLEEVMLNARCTRDTYVIALGGGIVTDVAGFVAATYCRGVPVIYIPTTLLAMVDASIGGKTGVNVPQGKNLIGAFKQPHCVYIDVDFLTTLPTVEFNNGMVELIKHALIRDADLFAELERQTLSLQDKNQLEHMIYRSCEIKRDIVEIDPEEKNMRQLLNFGHTVGHVIESVSHYDIRHGEAVALGMLIECYFSQQLGYLVPKALARIKAVLATYHLPLALPDTIKQVSWLDYFKMDKKSLNSQVYSVILEDIGRPYIAGGKYAHLITPDLLAEAQNYS